MLRVTLPLVLALCVLPKGVHADLIAVEPFSYTPGENLSGQSGGTGFSTAWEPGGFNASESDNYDVAVNSLNFADLSTSGNHVTTPATQNIAGVTRSLSRRFGPGETFYLSMLLRPEGTLGDGAFGGFFGLYLDSPVANDPDLFIGKAGGSNQYVMETRGGGGQVATDTTAVSGETSLLVLKGELVNGNDTFTLWVNRPPGEPEPTTFDGQKSDIDLSTFNSIVLYSSGAFSVDEIRIGETYADVTPISPAAVPEPSALTLLGLCGMGLAGGAFRKRRKTAQTA